MVLHSRGYKENSLLVELYTLNYGRISAVARVSKKSASRSRGVYQPFVLLKLSLRQGRGDLWQLNEAYIQRPAFTLEVPKVFCASYVNELIHYLVPAADSDPRLFAGYISTLEKLEQGSDDFVTLRNFESLFLDSLGYSIDFKGVDGDEIEPEGQYLFNPKSGFIRYFPEDGSYEESFCGRDILNIKNHLISAISTRKTLKNIHKTIINYLLDGKTLKSRDLYSQYLQVTNPTV